MPEVADLSGFEPSAGALRDRIILVTGATGGIGRQVCLDCAAAGAVVLLLDKDERGLNKLYDEIVSNGHPEPVEIVLDLSTMTAQHSEAICSQIADAFGRLDGIAHCAAAPLPLTPLEHTSLANWEQAVAVNLTAPWVLTRDMLPLLRQSSGAWVIFSSGEAGRTNKAYWSISGVTWGALDAMAGTWGEELESEQIGVISLDPGPVNTPMRTRLFPAEAPRDLNSSADASRAYLYLLCGKYPLVSGRRLTLRSSRLLAEA